MEATKTTNTTQEPKKKVIMVIETRIYFDGVLLAEASNHKAAVEKAKEFKSKPEYASYDICAWPPKKNIHSTTLAQKYHDQSDGDLHTPVNLTQGKVRKVRKPKASKPVESVDELEARIANLKKLISL